MTREICDYLLIISNESIKMMTGKLHFSFSKVLINRNVSIRKILKIQDFQMLTAPGITAMTPHS